MSLVDILPAATPMEGMLSHRPELLEKYRSFYQSFWQDGLVPRRTLELCRLRIAHIHSCAGELAVLDREVELRELECTALERGDFSVFTVAEQAALQLAELMPHAVHQISDDAVELASEHFGHPGCVALLTPLAFFDVSCRLKTVLEVPVQAIERTSASVL